MRLTALAVAAAVTAGTAAAVTAGVAGATGAPHAATVITVQPGQSIQAAVDRAHPGDTVQLAPGTWHESVTISTDRVTLRGSGTGTNGSLILPPAVFPDNECAEIPPEPGEAHGGGICVRGDADDDTDTVTRFVTGVRVTNLKVSGFAVNVDASASDGTRVDHIFATDAVHYDLISIMSKNDVFDHNTLRNANHAAMYVGNYKVPNSNLLITDNDIANGWYGLGVRDSQGVTIRNNNLHGNCSGLMVFDDTGKGGWPDGDKLLIEHNSVTANNVSCESELPGFPEVQGSGILLIGAQGATVRGNTVTGNTGSEPLSGGIVAVDNTYLLPQVEGNLTVTGNYVGHNGPADLVWDQHGTGVALTGNTCTTSSPAGLC